MKLENHVVSLELAQKLKSLGVKQESLFYWGQRKSPLRPVPPVYYSPDLFFGDKEAGLFVLASAFTVAELGEMLPPFLWNKGKTILSDIEYRKSDADGKVVYVVTCDSVEEIVIADTEADARAKMLVYLLENKLI